MAAYANVVGGRLKLKGKPLDVRAAGVKKKKKRETPKEQLRLLAGQEAEEEAKNSPSEAEPGAEAETKGEPDDGAKEEEEGTEEEKHEKQRAAGGGAGADQRTAAEKRYHEQKAKLEKQRLSRVACTSHRQRVEEFNQYLANLSEHYDIPKVGPG